jgi:hypothetical protein
MGLNWNEIKSRALLFSKTWADACNEDSQAKPFWIDFFEIFGISNKRVATRVATFELNVKKPGGAIDAAYQPSYGKKSYASDAERVAFLFDLYQRITSLLPAPNAKKTRKSKVTET